MATLGRICVGTCQDLPAGSMETIWKVRPPAAHCVLSLGSGSVPPPQNCTTTRCRTASNTVSKSVPKATNSVGPQVEPESVERRSTSAVVLGWAEPSTPSG